MKFCLLPIVSVFLIVTACQKKQIEVKKDAIKTQQNIDVVTTSEKEFPDAKTIFNKPEIPVLCYHRIRKILSSDGPITKAYTVEPDTFAQQMKILSDNGYHTISPLELYNYLTKNASLPSKPVMITFDDSREEQATIGAKEMDKYGFKGVFFVMTVTLNKTGYLTKEQIKNLSDNGHTIGAHSWDHHMVTKYKDEDWDLQLIKPKMALEKITGKPVVDFAYPNGVWNEEAISQIRKSGYQLAFIFYGKRDPNEPLYTVSRINVPGFRTAADMLKSIQPDSQKKVSYNSK